MKVPEKCLGVQSILKLSVWHGLEMFYFFASFPNGNCEGFWPNVTDGTQLLRHPVKTLGDVSKHNAFPCILLPH